MGIGLHQSRKRSHWLHALLLTGFVLFGAFPPLMAGDDQSKEKSTSQGKEGQSRAATSNREFQNLRYAEDWRPGPAGDGASRSGIKYLPLNGSGSIYASLGGQLRLRGENWSSFGFRDGADDTYGLSRLRLHADLYFGSRLRFFVEGKSALATGRDLPGGLRTLDVDSADLQNAFVEISAPDRSMGLKLGRQELQYGKQRLVSPLDWANSRRTFDVARASIRRGGWNIDGFWGMLVPVRKYDFNLPSQGESDFYGIYGTRTLAGPSLQWDVYWLGLNRNSALYGNLAASEDRQTFGSRMGGGWAGSGDFDLEGAFQVGTHGNQDIRAAMFTAQAGYSWTGMRWAPRAYVNFDYASGDGNPGDGKLGTFNQLFPLGHAYLGYIDIVGRQNIQDFSFGVSAVPSRKLRVTADLHSFWRASSRDALYNAGGGVVRPGILGDSREIGRELDLTGRYSFSRHLSAELGYCRFFTGAFLEESGSDAPTNFVYLQVLSTF